MINDKEIKAYISSIKSLLPVYSKEEREFVNKFRNNIYSYIDSHPDASTTDVIDQFGSAPEIVHGYIESIDIDTLVNAISVRRWMRRIAAIILLTAIISLSLFGAFYYKGYQFYKKTVITESETVVDSE